MLSFYRHEGGLICFLQSRFCKKKTDPATRTSLDNLSAERMIKKIYHFQLCLFHSVSSFAIDFFSIAINIILDSIFFRYCNCNACRELHWHCLCPFIALSILFMVCLFYRAHFMLLSFHFQPFQRFVQQFFVDFPFTCLKRNLKGIE